MPWGNAGVSNESYSMPSEMVGKQLSMISKGKELVEDDDDDSESLGMYGVCKWESRRLEKEEES